ncbi:hypothetical protein BC943DRAFT_196135 [Umbelopsis sp. AD052]|nr:hypothetical protein BC943DRAFT_196135 [Umbelopsis sp. AD052]
MSSFRSGYTFGSADIAHSPRLPNSPTTAWDSALSTEDKRAYAQFFKFADEDNKGFVTGDEAVRFFARSGVPNQILAEIWEAVDKDNSGILTQEAFSMALKLIACAQHGYAASSPLLTTSTPLPQFDGVTITNSPRLTSPFQTSSEDARGTTGEISAAAREKYSKMFLMAHPVNGVLDADSARNIFMKSNLSVDQLAKIWNLADIRHSGTLNQAEFVVAMHYIAGTMDGSITSLPSSLPPAIYNSAAGRSTPTSPVTRQFSGDRSLSPSFGHRFPSSSPSLQKQAIARQFTGSPLQAQASLSIASAFTAPTAANTHWDVTDQEKQKFDNFFDKIDARGTGFIQGNDAVEFFQNSRLPEGDLAQIWDLADTQQRGKLSREEFAVAMHIIHKRIGGQPIPRQLPITLTPPSLRPASQATPTFGSSSIASVPSPAFSSSVLPKPQASKSLIDDSDLLGDFDNNTQITADTNQVNQLQNQISDTISSTSNIRNQKLSIEETLAQLQKQKQEYSARLAQVQLAFNQENGDLQKLQETLSNEEPDLQRIRQEAEAAEANLTLLRNQKQDMERKIHDGRIESEQLRRRVTEIQEETKLLKLEIQNLQTSSRKQDMMLDVNRRQVTAADMDKSAATRELNEIREEHGLAPKDPTDFPNISKTQPSHELEKSDDVAEQSPFGSRPPTAQSFNQIFGSAFPARGESVTSPAMTMNSFDAAFEELASPTMNTSLPKERPYSPFTSMPTTLSPVDANVNQPQAQPSAADPFAPGTGQQKPITSFDDAFGDFEETNDDVTAPPLEEAPKPSSSAFDDSFLRKRGTDLTIQDEDDSSDDDDVVLSKVQAKNVSSPTTINTESAAPPVTEAPKQSGFDDFDEAFNGKLGEAQVAPTSGAKDFDQAFSTTFDEFDDSFEKPHQADEVKATNSKEKGKFGAFDFSDFEEKLDASSGGGVQDDLDSLFGSPSIPAGHGNVNPSAQALSFEDAFGGFDAPPTKTTTDAPAAQKPTSAPAEESSAVQVQPDDKEEIKQLVGMGFSRAQAVDALRRYDNNLEKATNFLLDN